MRQSAEGLVSEKLAQSPGTVLSPEGGWYSQPAKSCTQSGRKKSRDITALIFILKKKKIFFRWEDIPETVIISSVFLTA